MVTIKDWYKRVNDLWPKDADGRRALPTLTYDEAERAARRLFRWAGLKFDRYEQARADAVTWLRYRDQGWTVSLNPRHGWHELIHMISHICNRKAGHKPHGREHARLELGMIKQVLKRGWLQGTLKTVPVVKPEPAPAPIPSEAPVSRTAVKLSHAERMLKTAITRHKRAATLLKKWQRRVNYYSRSTP
jgi:hypothetical protein